MSSLTKAISGKDTCQICGKAKKTHICESARTSSWLWGGDLIPRALILVVSLRPKLYCAEFGHEASNEI